MMKRDFMAVLNKIQYKEGYVLMDRLIGTGISEVWWSFYRPDMRTGEGDTGTSGSTLIRWGNPEIDVESIVRQVFGMTLRLEEHECREFFKYQERRPFDPHIRLLETRESRD